MKRATVGVLLFLMALCLAVAHEPGEDSTSIDLGNGKVSIHYGTPKLNNRNLDEMIKPGTPWRMGMNKPTSLETSIALDFGGKTLPAGKYTMFARPDENKKWTLLLSSGTRPDAASIVIEAPLHFMKDEKSEELLKIRLEKTSAGASLSVAWGNYRLHGTFKAGA